MLSHRLFPLTLAGLALVIALVLSGLLIIHPAARALPPAGSDYVHVTADVLIKSRIGTETVHLRGTATIGRQDPHLESGVQVVDDQITSLSLVGDPPEGHVTVNQSFDLSSTGAIRSQQAAQEYPADASFDAYLEVRPPTSGLQVADVLHNRTAIHLTNASNITTWPPSGVQFTADPTETGTHCSPSASPPGPGGIALFPPPDFATPMPGQILGDPLQICIVHVAVTLSVLSTPTPTLTRTPTFTPTPTEVPGPAMQELVFPNWTKSPPVCGPGVVGRTCSLLPSSFFSVDVKSSPPTGGFSGYEIVIRYTGNLTLWDQQGITENRWPGCPPNYGSDTLTPPANGQPGQYVLVCKGTLQSYNGFLANIHFSCSSGTSDGQIDIVGGAGANVSFFELPSIYGSHIWLTSSSKGTYQVADSVHIHCGQALPDSCADFDGDGIVGVNDILYVAQRYGTADPAADLDGDGKVTVADILSAVHQYNAACSR